MFQHRGGRHFFRRPLFNMVFIGLAVGFLAACAPGGLPGSSNTGSSPPSSSTPFTVSSVDLKVAPDSIAGTTCGSNASFTYTATFHIPAGTAGGSIQFMYTLNNGHSSTNASVNVAAGQTTQTYTFTSSGTLPPDHTYPGIAEVIVTSPNAVNSPQVHPTGSCTSPTFQVTSVDLTVSPASIARTPCGSSVSFTYTATFHIPAGTGGGAIQFQYTLNNGRSSTSASVAVYPDQTTQTYTFTSSGQLPADHTYPGIAEVMVTSPNQVNSPQVVPTGACGTPAAFQVTSIDLAVNPTSIAGMHCSSQITVTYTATFHIAANGPGGTIQFMYTFNSGRGTNNASITVGAGQTTATYTFTWSGQLPPPGFGEVISSSPNVVDSPQVGPTGNCS